MLNHALTIESDNTLVLISKGRILCEIAEYEAAARVLERATQLNPHDIMSLSLKGWALQFLGPQKLQEAKQTCEDALELDPRNTWILRDLADILRKLGEREEADVKYFSIIKQAEELVEMDVDTLSLIGWCHYCLGHHEEAVRLFIEALAINPYNVSIQFDFALTLMCSGGYTLGLREYEKGLEWIKRRGTTKRRELLYVALDDLKDAVRHFRLKETKEVQKVKELLKNAFDREPSPVEDISKI